jgi:RNA polymerase primary sigma factor
VAAVRDVREIHLLTAADELRLARRIEHGDTAAKEELVTANLRLVSSFAARYQGRGVPFEDLVQEGTVGLLRAAERFDHRRELRFSTYAGWWIRRALAEAVGGVRAIRVPAHARRRMAAIARANDDLRREAGGAPTTGAIAQRTGLSERTVRTLETSARVAASLDEPVGEHATPLIELIAGTDGSDVWLPAETAEARRSVWAMLRLLPARHRDVVLRRYGFIGDRAHSHEEIAAHLGVGVERSRQLEGEALHRLRELATGGRSAA